MLTYKIQEDTSDANAFKIDSVTGLITTTALLDRESKDVYNIILEVSDNGKPSQSVTRILRINVLDIDDHKPRFVRDIVSITLKNYCFLNIHYKMQRTTAYFFYRTLYQWKYF